MHGPENQSQTHTADGYIIKVNTSAYSLEEVEAAADSGADGLGLFSTDFMYCNNADLPSEEEQYRIFKKVSQIMDNRPVTVRTLNLKPSQVPALNNLGLPEQCRGVRLGLELPEILKTQIRALARASVSRNFRLLLPMVSDVSEILKVKALIDGVQRELNEKNIEYDSYMEIGIEVEIPAAIVLAQVLSFEVSFFNISENLKNYTLAIDNEGYGSNLIHEYAPSFLFQIANLAEEVRKRKKSVSVESPLAGEPAAVPILISMGVNELIMAPGQIERARQVISRLTVPKAKLVASKAMSFRFPEEIKQYAEESLPRLLK
ncbi:putative PEP-binding protein [Desulfotruncus alcoholivorax]|uniref:putative PEP-binding protein n=1 Tax=Desulfotruncus alcoholivorax TaxID=265477 RepID=UPI000421CDCA|nr:putative PEP-binding protein [Desulfotruncus alcoholivorax]